MTTIAHHPKPLVQNLPVPTEPVIFSKFASAITDPGAPILLAPEVQELDFEVELVIVMGKDGRRIKVRWGGGDWPKENGLEVQG